MDENGAARVASLLDKLVGVVKRVENVLVGRVGKVEHEIMQVVGKHGPHAVGGREHVGDVALPQRRLREA